MDMFLTLNDELIEVIDLTADVADDDANNFPRGFFEWVELGEMLEERSLESHWEVGEVTGWSEKWELEMGRKFIGL